MAHSAGVITDQVDMGDVQAVLGVASTNNSVLCTHANINIWAKNKPIRIASFDSVTDAQKVSAKWGLQPVEFDGAAHPSFLYNKVIENGGAGYKYNRPAGGDTTPFRLGDFGGYNHYAPFPVVLTKNFVGTTMKPQYSDSPKLIYITIDWQTLVSGAEVDIKEMYIGYAPNPVNNQCFLGVMLMETSGTVLGWTTGLNSGTEAKMTKITLPNYWTDRNVLLFFFLANYNLEGSWFAGSNESTNKEITFWALPNNSQNPNPVQVQMEKFVVPGPGYTLEWYASIVQGSKVTCSFHATLTSTTSAASISAQNVRFNFYKNKEIYDYLDIYVNSLSVYIGGTDTEIVSGVIAINLNNDAITEVRAVYNTVTKVIWER